MAQKQSCIAVQNGTTVQFMATVVPEGIARMQGEVQSNQGLPGDVTVTSTTPAHTVTQIRDAIANSAYSLQQELGTTRMTQTHFWEEVDSGPASRGIQSGAA